MPTFGIRHVLKRDDGKIKRPFSGDISEYRHTWGIGRYTKSYCTLR